MADDNPQRVTLRDVLDITQGIDRKLDDLNAAVAARNVTVAAQLASEVATTKALEQRVSSLESKLSPATVLGVLMLVLTAAGLVAKLAS